MIGSAGWTAHTRNGRIADIEVLRGWAIIWVVIWHLHFAHDLFPLFQTPITPYLRLGVGVDLFFVISGFVISRSLLPLMDKAQDFPSRLRVSYSFWIRRISRLFPAAWLWLAVVVFCSLLFPQTGYWINSQNLSETAVSVIFQFMNYHIGRHIEDVGPAAIYWSLSLEEQFYIILPVILLVNSTRKFLVSVLLFVIVIQIFFDRSFQAIWFRSEGLALGVLLGVLREHSVYEKIEPRFLERPFFRNIVVGAIAFAIVTVNASPVREAIGFSYSSGLNFVALFCAVLVFFASYDRNYIERPGRWRDIIIWTGARSYAMYLCHLPVIYLCLGLTKAVGMDVLNRPAHKFVTVFFIILAIIIAADFTYRRIERPLRKTGVRRAKAVLRAD
ncbi:MAG: acyltransferase [Pseudomonadota bacterium]